LRSEKTRKKAVRTTWNQFEIVLAERKGYELLLQKPLNATVDKYKIKANAYFLTFPRKCLISLTRQVGRASVAQTESKKTNCSSVFITFRSTDGTSKNTHSG
jgi:cyclophilin family peptidyl-prolyl cis-trans isomerase